MYRLLYGIACYAYSNGVRELVKKAIDDPNEAWDDLALAALDRIFNYNG